MADYDLGTAHGRIKIDYDGKGFRDADRDMSGIGSRTKSLLGAFGSLRSRWSTDLKGMSGDISKFSASFGVLTGALAIAQGSLQRTGGATLQLRGGLQILKSFQLALGGLPKGAEKFPSVVKNIIQVAAAVKLLQSSGSLLANMLSRLRAFTVLSNLFKRFGTDLLAFASRFGVVQSIIGRAGTIFNSLSGGVRTANAALQGFASTALRVASAISLIGKAKEFIKDMAKPLLATQAGLAGLGAASYTIMGLIDGIKQLTGLIGLLPGGMMAAGIAAATLVVGLQGIKDAVTKGKGLENLAQSARAAVVEIRSLKDAWTDVQRTVQQALFAGTAEQIHNLAEIYFPMLKTRMADVATSLNAVVMRFAAFAQERQTITDMGTAFGLTSTIINNLARGVQPFLQALRDIGVVGMQVIAEMTTNVGNLATRFAAFIAQARQSGQLKAWIEGGVQALRDLWTIAVQVYQTLSTIFTGLAGGQAQGFLSMLAQATTAMNNFFKSAQGQAILGTLRGMIVNAMNAFRELGNVFVTSVLPAIQAMLPYWQQMGQAFMGGVVIALRILAPLFQALGQALQILAPVLTPIVTAMVAFGVTALGIVVALKIVGSAITILRVGLMGLRGAWALAGFGARLLTGNLGPVEGMIVRVCTSGIAWIGRLAMTLITNAARMAAAWLVAMGPVGWVILAITAIGVAFAVLWAKSQTFRTVVTAAWNGIKAAATGVANWFMGLPGMIGGALSSLGSTISGAFTAVVTFFTGLPARIGALLTSLGTWISTRASAAWNGLTTTLGAAINAVGTFFAQLPGKIAFALGFLAGLVYLGATNAWKWLSTSLPAAWTAVTTFFASLPARVGAFFVGLGTAIMTGATTAWHWLVGAAQTAWTALTTFITTLPATLMGFLTGLGASIQAGATAAWNFLVTTAQTSVQAVLAFIAGLPGMIGGALSSLGSTLSAAASAAWSAFTAACTAGATAALNFIKNVPTQIKGFFAGAASWLVAAGQAILQGLWNGMKAIANQVLAWISNIGARIKAGFNAAIHVGSPSRDFHDSGVWIMQGLLNGLKSLAGTVVRYVSQFGSDIARVGNAQMLTAGAQMGQSIRAGLESQLPAIQDAFGRIQNLIGNTRLGLGALGVLFDRWGRWVGGWGSSGSPKPPPTTGTAPVTPTNAIATYVPSNPYAAASGGDTPTIVNNTIESVTIDGSTIETMNNVQDFFDKITQKARAGKAG